MSVASSCPIAGLLPMNTGFCALNPHILRLSLAVPWLTSGVTFFPAFLLASAAAACLLQRFGEHFAEGGRLAGVLSMGLWIGNYESWRGAWEKAQAEGQRRDDERGKHD